VRAITLLTVKNLEMFGGVVVLTIQLRRSHPTQPPRRSYHNTPQNSHQHSSTCRDKNGAIFDLLYQAIRSISRRTTTLTSTVNTA
jgi:hypothetical protein